MGKKFVIIWLLIFIFAINFPYIYGFACSTRESEFIGFIQNPMDGNSYLAKMYQGYQGNWTFHLPYSIERGKGSYLFLFYLALGHISRLFSLPLILVFHLARNAGSISLFLTMALFIKLFLPLPAIYQKMALILTMFGSGLGWAALLFSITTSDFIVPEAFPFLSSYTNPHFPLGLAFILLFLIFTYSNSPHILRTRLICLLIGTILAVVNPFGVVVLFAITCGMNLWLFATSKRIEIWDFICLLGGGGALVYQYLVITMDPILSIWNSQNITPAPPIWDVLISFSPAILLALSGIKRAKKNLPSTPFFLLLGWGGLGLLLTYLPFNLQRRFMLGLYIPWSLLSVLGIWVLVDLFNKNGTIFRTGIIAISLVTNLIIEILGFFGILSKQPSFFISQYEKEALTWIENQTPKESSFLAPKNISLLIPAWTGRRVLYGHPFETINASQREKELEQFFQARMTVVEMEQLIEENHIQFILSSDQEKTSSEVINQLQMKPVFTNREIRIYNAKTFR